MKKLLLSTSLLALATFTENLIQASGIIYNVGTKPITITPQIPPKTTGGLGSKGVQYSLPAGSSIQIPASGQYVTNVGKNDKIDFDAKTISTMPVLATQTPSTVVFNITDDIYVNSQLASPWMNLDQYTAIQAGAAAIQAGAALTVYNNTAATIYIAPAGSTTFSTIPQQALAPSNYITLQTPGQYVICNASNGTGPALAFTYANTTTKKSTPITSCYLQNGAVSTSLPTKSLASVNNTGKMSISAGSDPITGWAAAAQ